MPYPSSPVAAPPERRQNEQFLPDPEITTPLPTTASQNLGWSDATQELLDTLPQVWTKGLLYFLALFTAILVPWTMLTKVDEVGTARGRIEPQGQTLRLDAPVEGTVASVRVKEGQTVSAGQVLVELDTQLLRVDLQQAQSKLEGQLERLAQTHFIKTQLQLSLQAQRLQNRAQLAAQEAQIQQTRQELALNHTTDGLVQELLQQDSRRVERFRTLQQEGAIPLIQVEDAERALNETQQRLEKVKSDEAQGESELSKQQSTYDRTLREGELALISSERELKELQSQINSLQSDITQSRDQIKSLQIQIRQRLITAPIAGTIFQLPVKNAGTVVQASQAIAQIAPKGSSLILKAQMPSQESGFLQVGRPVKVKFDAYPFADYGTLPGRVRWIAPDSRITETPQGKLETFELDIAFDRPYLSTPTQRIPLTPGQTATAEVIIRQRRIIDFIIDPLQKLQKDGLKL